MTVTPLVPAVIHIQPALPCFHCRAATATNTATATPMQTALLRRDNVQYVIAPICDDCLSRLLEKSNGPDYLAYVESLQERKA